MANLQITDFFQQCPEVIIRRIDGWIPAVVLHEESLIAPILTDDENVRIKAARPQ